MSDDYNEGDDSDNGSYDHYMDYHDNRAFGSPAPTESKPYLPGTVKQDRKQYLKQELQLGYRSMIAYVPEGIYRKRRAAQLLDGTTAIVKNWLDVHPKWPYPPSEGGEGDLDSVGAEASDQLLY